MLLDEFVLAMDQIKLELSSAEKTSGLSVNNKTWKPTVSKESLFGLAGEEFCKFRDAMNKSFNESSIEFQHHYSAAGIHILVTAMHAMCKFVCDNFNIPDGHNKGVAAITMAESSHELLLGLLNKTGISNTKGAIASSFLRSSPRSKIWRHCPCKRNTIYGQHFKFVKVSFVTWGKKINWKLNCQILPPHIHSKL